MPAIPDPLTPLVITGGVVTNLASHFVMSSMQKLEKTHVGKLLKRAGPIKPDFADRVSKTLSQTIERFFETFPQYRLTGIQAFLQDPSVVRQICDHILDGRPIAQDQIQHALKKHLETDVTMLLIKREGLCLDRIVSDFLQCYRQVLRAHLDEPLMEVLLQILELKTETREEIKASEERLTRLLEKILGKLGDPSSEKRREINAEIQSLGQNLGINRSEDKIVQELRTRVEKIAHGPIFKAGGLCDGYALRPRPKQYFVSQEFRADRNDLRNALDTALSGFGVEPVCADDFYASGHILCKVSALIQSTPFGIYQLTDSQNRCVHLELGIALGLQRPFILVKDREAEVSHLLQGLEYYHLQSYRELSYEFGNKLGSFMSDISSYKTHDLPRSGLRRTAVISHGELRDKIDFTITVAKEVAQSGFTPVILGNLHDSKLECFLKKENIPYEIVGTSGKTVLDETVKAIQSARMGIYRLENSVRRMPFWRSESPWGSTVPH